MEEKQKYIKRKKTRSQRNKDVVRFAEQVHSHNGTLKSCDGKSIKETLFFETLTGEQSDYVQPKTITRLRHKI